MILNLFDKKIKIALYSYQMEDIAVRQASLDDLTTLQKIGRETFYETFVDTNTEEDMRKYLEESFALEKLTEEIAQPNTRFFMATQNNEAIGYLKVNSSDAQTELKEADSLEIERIYVLKAFQGKKIGQILYSKAMEIAIDEGLKSIWLGVWEENYRALRFYEKNGFEVFDKHIFRLGNDEQTDLMMRKQLN